MINTIGSYIKKFNNLPNDKYRARVVVKTLTVSAIISMAIGYFAGPTCKKIGFFVIAPIYTVGILDRLSKPTFVFTNLEKNFGKKYKKVRHDAADVVTKFDRAVENADLKDQNLSQKQRTEIKKGIAVRRTVQDVLIATDRFFNALGNEIKYTMSL